CSRRVAPRSSREAPLSAGPIKEEVRRMRVYEVAQEFDVSSEALVHLLREMDIPVRSHMTMLADEHVARLRTVLERERRLGRKSAEEASEHALEDAGSAPRRRRRRRAEQPAPAEERTEVEASDSTASPTADAAEAIAAEAAEEAAERGAEPVTEEVRGTPEAAPSVPAPAAEAAAPTPPPAAERPAPAERAPS